MRKSVLFQVIVASLAAVIVAKLTGPDYQVLGVPVVRIYDLIGRLFLNALSLVVVPLVASSIITGTARIGRENAFGVIGKATFGIFFLTAVLAITTGIACALWLGPGVGVDGQSLVSVGQQSLDLVKAQASQGLFDRIEGILFRIVPNNILAVASQNQMLGLILFSLLFGYFITRIEQGLSETLTRFWQAIFQVMMKMTHLVMGFLPIGVFGLMAKVVATTDQEAIRAIAYFVVTDVVALGILALVIYPLIVKLIARRSPLQHASAMAPALVTAFSTSSTAATLPATLDCAEKRAGLSNAVCSFTLPLGVSLNITGSALHSVVAVVFIAQAYGSAIDATLIITLGLMGVFAAMGMIAGVPSASLVAVVTILQTVGLPAEGIGLILAVDRILDMIRTTVTVWGNSCCAAVVARFSDLPPTHRR